MDEMFIAFIFSAYVTVGPHCEYQQVGIAMNNHNQVVVMTEGLKIHLKTIEPFYQYKFMQDLMQDSTQRYYGFDSQVFRNGNFTFTFQQKEYIGNPDKRFRRLLFSNRWKFTISSLPCEIKQ